MRKHIFSILIAALVLAVSIPAYSGKKKNENPVREQYLEYLEEAQELADDGKVYGLEKKLLKIEEYVDKHSESVPTRVAPELKNQQNESYFVCVQYRARAIAFLNGGYAEHYQDAVNDWDNVEYNNAVKKMERLKSYLQKMVFYTYEKDAIDKTSGNKVYNCEEIYDSVKLGNFNIEYYSETLLKDLALMMQQIDVVEKFPKKRWWQRLKFW